MDPWAEVKNQATKIIKEATGLDASKTFEEPKQEFGELSTIIAFDLAKKEKKNPAQIAGELVKKFDLKESLFLEVGAAGPYINFKLDWPKFAKFVVAEILRDKDKYGEEDYFTGKVLLEFPSVNPNKPWHIGHARNAVLGDSVARLMKAVGFRVTAMDYIDDLGLQVAKTYWITKGKKSEGKYDHWLGKMYVEAEKNIQENPDFEREVRDIMVQMEKGALPSVKKMCEDCVKAQYETAFRFGIYHDLLVWESSILQSGLFEKGLQTMLKCNYIHKVDDGKKASCIVADLSNFQEMKDLLDTDKVLVRADGTPTYTGKDVTFHMWKVGLLKDAFRYAPFIKQPNGKVALTTAAEGQTGIFEPADMLVNVIGSEQAQPQRLVYLTLRTMGYKKWDKIFHLSYEHVELPDEKLSGRKGTWIGYSADGVVDEAVERAKKIIDEKNPDLKNKEKVAEAIGVGAVRFTLLKTAPEKKISFEWERALSFEGESGPYCQYSHARACRILEKAEIPEKARFDKLNPKEKELLLLMAKYPNSLKSIVLAMRQEVWGTNMPINLLPDMAVDLASVFNQFYNESPVLKAESGVREARIQLVAAFRQVMHNILGVLGIEALKMM